MKIAIITTKNGTVEVHAAGCADVSKSAKRNRDDAWVIEVDSLVEVSEQYWSDIISDEHDPQSAEGKALAREYATSQFNCLPCAKDLPFEVAGLEVVTLDGEETTVTVEATTPVTTWVGKAIAQSLLYRPGTLSDKILAAKATKAGDRTVKLTAEEVTELRAICTELEALGGSIAYSARTLRARLA